MLSHLGGKAHAFKCRDAKLEEIMYVKERERLEYILTGKPVVRLGFTRPKSDILSQSQNSRANDQAQTITEALPEGWEAYTDPNTTTVYFWHSATETVEWDRSRLQAQSEGEMQASTQLEHDLDVQAKPQCALPDGWEVYTDPHSRRVYYFHSATNHAQWKRPLAVQSLCDLKAQPAAEALPPGWTRLWDSKCGRYYYADLQEQRSQIDPP